MGFLRIFIVFLALCEGGYMLVDGLVALATGSYLTPGGRGELGPWAALVSAAHVDPASRTMHAVFVAFGAAYFGCIAAYLARLRWAGAALAALAAATLWYLPVGTLLSLLQLLGLALERRLGRSGRYRPNRR
jgi:hypothetical protein